MARIAVLCLAVVLLIAAAPASAARSRSCGSYAKSDGSLADGVVTEIAVVGTNCRAGQKVAGRYTGVAGTFKAAGFACVGAQAGNPAQQSGIVRCTKRRERVTYRNAPMTDCSTTPGVQVPSSTGTPISGPWSYNTDCQTAVTVVNAATGAAGTLPAGWTCADNTSAAAPGGFCNLRSGTTYDVVQWNDNVEPPGSD